MLLWSAVGLIVYAGLFSRAVFDDRGRVLAQLFGPLDAGIAAGLIMLFSLVVLGGIHSGGNAPALPKLPDAHSMIMAVVINSAIFLAVIFGILMTLYARRIDLATAFGMRAQGPGGIIARAALLMGLAFPLIWITLTVSNFMLGAGGDAGEQEVVRFFVRSNSGAARAAVALSAVVLAPLQEEFIFRGYLYPVLKRYGGPALGVLVNAALFAGIHLHLPSFAGLFVLATCLTLAYEWTGSLLVPMAMHSMFNSLTVINLLHRG